LRKQGIELIAPHKTNRKKPRTQDGRPLRRYRNRWKIERLFAWLQNFRRIQTRHEHILENYLGFVLLGCMVSFSDPVFETTSSLIRSSLIPECSARPLGRVFSLERLTKPQELVRLGYGKTTCER